MAAYFPEVLYRNMHCVFSLTSHYFMLAKRSTAFVNFLMVMSASPCWMPSRTQCWICPSSTICPTRCKADLHALICESTSSQGISSSIMRSTAWFIISERSWSRQGFRKENILFPEGEDFTGTKRFRLKRMRSCLKSTATEHAGQGTGRNGLSCAGKLPCCIKVLFLRTLSRKAEIGRGTRALPYHVPEADRIYGRASAEKRRHIFSWRSWAGMYQKQRHMKKGNCWWSRHWPVWEERNR